MLTTAVRVLLAGQASAGTLAAVGAAYLGLVLASIYVSDVELRLPLIHYRSRMSQARHRPLSL